MIEGTLGPLAKAWVAQAPVCMDVMGGIAEYTGSIALTAATGQSVQVVATPRNDQQIRVACSRQFDGTTGASIHHGPAHNGAPSAEGWTNWLSPLSIFYGSDHQLTDPAALVARLQSGVGDYERSVIAVACALLESRTIEHFGGGVTVSIAMAPGAADDAATEAAVLAATAAVLARVYDVHIEPIDLARISRRAGHLLMGQLGGLATPCAPLLANGGSLLQVCCASETVRGNLDMPDGVTVIGINCDKRHERAREKYHEARVTAMMGREIIRRIMAVSNGQAGHRDGSGWDGFLARLSVTDYVDSFRDRLPTKLKGGLFLERFGDLDGETDHIDPRATYKVRSRAEHHIYENERVRQFVERLGRASRTRDNAVVAEAGELMYASHWSYGQRCGLGSIETDILVNLLRAKGTEHGVYGARISGPGAGGTVVALVRTGDATEAAVRDVVAAYDKRTGLSSSLLRAADKHAAGFSVRRLD